MANNGRCFGAPYSYPLKSVLTVTFGKQYLQRLAAGWTVRGSNPGVGEIYLFWDKQTDGEFSKSFRRSTADFPGEGLNEFCGSVAGLRGAIRYCVSYRWSWPALQCMAPRQTGGHTTGCCCILRNVGYWLGSHKQSLLFKARSYLLTYSMVQSPWEANWFAARQEIPSISRNPKVHYRTHKRPPPVSILGQTNPVHIHAFHLLEIHPNIIHPSTPRSPQWSPSLRFPQQEPIHLPFLNHTRHTHKLTHKHVRRSNPVQKGTGAHSASCTVGTRSLSRV